MLLYCYNIITNCVLGFLNSQLSLKTALVPSCSISATKGTYFKKISWEFTYPDT